MATVGCLGDIPFEVSSERVRTFSNMKREFSASYSTHKRIGGKALPEFSGVGLEKITFEMILSAYLGINPQKEVDRLADYLRKGKALPLVIGQESVGTYRWTVQSLNSTVQHTDANGRPLTIKASVTLQEYPKE